MTKQPSLRKKSILLMVFLSLILAWGQTTNVHAQDIDYSAGCPFPGAFVFPPVVAGSPITPINIAAINTPMGAAATMSIQSVSQLISGFEIPVPGPYTSPFVIPGTGITINATGATVNVSGTPDNSTVGTTLIFTLRATANGTPCDKTFHLPISRKPVVLAVVLDQSGSMGTGYDGGGSPPAGQRRWDGLVTGVGAMATQLGFNTLLTDDKLGLILFSSGLNPSPAPFNSPLVSLQTNYSLLEGSVSPLTPGGSTSLGNGIVEARNRLLTTGSTTRKVMIVFSDGVQNDGDQVRTVIPNQYTQTVGGENISGSGAIEIYTICLGSSGHNPVLMQGIASANNGQSMVTSTGQESDFTTFFTTQIINILSGSSPQYIDVRRGSFPTIPEGYAHSEQTFTVNKGANAVNAIFIIPNHYEANFVSISKDGTDYTPFAAKIRGSGFISIGFRFPAYGIGSTLDGQWKVSVKLGAGTKTEIPYTCAFITDDHAIHPTYTTTKESYKVGDTLNTLVSLKKLGKSLNNATVELLIAKPGDDVNDLIALSTINFTPSSIDPGSPDVAKLAELLKDSVFLNKIKANNQLINLTYNSSTEEYTGSFKALDVAGVYQLFYRINANDSSLGKIERFHQKTVYVRFPDVDLPNSGIVVTAGTNGNAVINWRPKASNGKFIGSGWGGAIGIEGANITTLTDHGDGSYTINLDAPLDKEVKIVLSDDQIYSGPIKDFGNKNGTDCKIFNIPCWLFWTLVILIILFIAWFFLRKK